MWLAFSALQSAFIVIATIAIGHALSTGSIRRLRRDGLRWPFGEWRSGPTVYDRRKQPEVFWWTVITYGVLSLAPTWFLFFTWVFLPSPGGK